MDKTYNPHDIESHWYTTWEKSNYFAPQGSGSPYAIMIPPPNVTGSLHMGHGFQNTLMDALVRYKRMDGHNTLWQVGTDHAGIATQMMVERQLAKDNVKRHDLGRDKFVEKVWDWKHQSGGRITQQLRRLGASVDWSRERFTMDEGLSKAVNKTFIQLYEEGLIYRGKRLVNWDPKFHTAISDLEVISTEENGKLWHIRYPLVEREGFIEIATTRPETLLGDVAVAVNPKDDRYQDLIGCYAQLPLTGRTIPIIADDYVDPEFGSGCVKITPAHDFNDYAMGQRHKLPLLNILTDDACLNDDVPEAYRGMDRFVARKQIIKDLESQGLLVRIDDHKLMIPRGDRSGEIIEPYLTDQWYVKAQPLAEPAIAAVEKGDIRFVPANWDKTYFQWMRNIEDWCISRQLWWGHRIPAWYDDKGKIYVGDNEEAIRVRHNLGPEVSLVQDPDVLDTWFSSSLWPFSTLGWPEQTPELNDFYPTSVLVTGFDIIFFWVARMIMMGLKLTGKVPFHEVYVTGLIRDQEGQKMSKTKGNVLDPLDLIEGIELDALVEKRVDSLLQPKMAPKVEKQTRAQFPEGIPAFGTDALRMTFCALASTGRDIRFDLGRLEGYRNFCNKLWNASRYVLMNTEDKMTSDHKQYSLACQWIQSRLQRTIETLKQHLDNYRFDLATQTLYEFTWNEYCDWYLELTKPLLYSETTEKAILSGVRHTLVVVLETLLRLMHPLMPFITEEIWQRVAPLTGIEGDTIMLQPYPGVNTNMLDDTAEAEVTWLQQVIIGVRTIRAEMNIPPSKGLTVYFAKTNKQDETRINNNLQYLKQLAKIDELHILQPDEATPDAATALAGQMEILIPLAGFIDKDAETERLTKEIEKLNKEIMRAEGKLQNKKFIDNAPSAVVEKEKARLAETQQAQTQLQAQLEKIQKL